MLEPDLVIEINALNAALTVRRCRWRVMAAEGTAVPPGRLLLRDDEGDVVAHVRRGLQAEDVVSMVELYAAAYAVGQRVGTDAAQRRMRAALGLTQ